MTVVVFRKAFNSIHRGKMKMILYTLCQRHLGSEKKTEAVVPSADGETFATSAGVLQGETLALHLFVIVLHRAMRTAIGEDDAALGFITTTSMKQKASRKGPN